MKAKLSVVLGQIWQIVVKRRNRGENGGGESRAESGDRTWERHRNLTDPLTVTTTYPAPDPSGRTSQSVSSLWYLCAGCEVGSQPSAARAQPLWHNHGPTINNKLEETQASATGSKAKIIVENGVREHRASDGEEEGYGGDGGSRGWRCRGGTRAQDETYDCQAAKGDSSPYNPSNLLHLSRPTFSRATQFMKSHLDAKVVKEDLYAEIAGEDGKIS